MSAYVPIDLHRHRSVVMHVAAGGRWLGGRHRELSGVWHRGDGASGGIMQPANGVIT
jgi:hypothetical protein